jgi:hypothetical protein
MPGTCMDVASIASIHLLAPEDLPRGWNKFDGMRGCAPSAVSALLAARFENDKTQHLLDLLKATVPQSMVAIVHDRPAADRAGSNDHDQYCRVVRVRGDAHGIFVNGVAQVYLGLIEDFTRERSSVPLEGRARLYTAIESILSAATGRADGKGGAVAFDAAVRDARPIDSLRRWIRGHQVFLVITQGLIIACHQLGAALAAARRDVVDQAFERTAELLNGAAFAFRFTGDFAIADYEGVVRPSMMPPVAPAGMSGLLSSDHAHLVKLMSTLKPQLATLDPLCLPAYRRFREALAGAYDAHRFVCERFSGGEKPSLLTALKTEMAAVEVLDRFKRSRLGMLPDAQDASGANDANRSVDNRERHPSC